VKPAAVLRLAAKLKRWAREREERRATAAKPTSITVAVDD
jgi:hypothetical protein